MFPHRYAAAILALPAAERRAALQEVPEAWRDWVREHLNDWKAKRRALRLHRQQQQQAGWACGR